MPWQLWLFVERRAQQTFFGIFVSVNWKGEGTWRWGRVTVAASALALAGVWLERVLRRRWTVSGNGRAKTNGQDLGDEERGLWVARRAKRDEKKKSR